MTGAYWSAVADLFASESEDEEDKSGQGSVSQATPGALDSGVVETSLISQVVLGDANVHVDAVVCKKKIYVHQMHVAWRHTHIRPSLAVIVCAGSCW